MENEDEKQIGDTFMFQDEPKSLFNKMPNFKDIKLYDNIDVEKD